MAASAYLNEAEALLPELSKIRQELHSYPEIGNAEFKTAELIEKELRALGLEPGRVLETAVIADINFSRPGKLVALRADMDALPVSEQTGCEFSSRVPGMMHACGHDVHMTAVLGAAKILCSHRDELAGGVRLIFEPDEEGSGGARRLIEAGCLDGVSAVFGCHVSPDLPQGAAGIKYGKFYAASAMFNVTVTGLSCHGAEREKGHDALLAACEMITAVSALNRSGVDDKCVLTVGKVSAGTASNIVAGTAEFSGIIRTLSPEQRQETAEKFRGIISSIADKHSVSVRCDVRMSYDGVINTPFETEIAEHAAKQALGEENVYIIQSPTMTTEDFGYYIQKTGAGCFYHIGAGSSYPLHNPSFLPSETAIASAAALHCAVITEYLKEN